MVILLMAAGLASLWWFRTKAGTRMPGSKRKVIPEAVGMVVMTAQLSELIKVVEHLSIVTVIAAVLLLAIVVAFKTGSESELY